MIRAAKMRSYLPEARLPRFEQAGAAAGPLRGNDFFVWQEPFDDDAFLVNWGGQSYVCPRNFRLRMLEGMLAYNNAFPDAGLIPEHEVVDASTRLEAMRDGTPERRSFILTSPWHVPVRWFAPFLHEERELYDRQAGLSIRYRALMMDAQARVERAKQIVEAAGFDSGIVSQISSLASWLDAFPQDGMLELDYGPVAELFPEGDLALDESAADLAASLHALEHGDTDQAASHYQMLARRWGRAQALAFSN